MYSWAGVKNFGMKNIWQLYRFLNLVSVDVACGAMVCAAFFARIFQIELRPQGLAALGITVWIIYAVDHLLDARQLKKEASTKRHLLHQRNFRAVCTLVAVGVMIDLCLILFIRRQVFVWGMGLAIVVLLYLLFQRLITPFKEATGALLYAGGVLLPVLSLHITPLSASLLFLMIAFVLTALINLVLFSWFDLEHDRNDTQLSLVTFFGKQNSKRVLSVLFLLQGFLLTGLLVSTPYKTEALILGSMNVALVILLVASDWFKQEDIYRQAGDFIFLFPLPYVILNG